MLVVVGRALIGIKQALLFLCTVPGSGRSAVGWARSLLFGCAVGSQVGMVLPGWKAKLEAKKAFEFGYVWEFVKQSH